MFRLVNSTKNIRNKPNRTILNSIHINHFCFLRLQLSLPVYRLRETSYQKTNSGSQLRNSASQWTNSPSQCDNSASQWRNSLSQWRNTASQWRNSPSQLGNTPSQWRNSPSQWRNTASQWRKSGHHWKKTISVNLFLIEFSIWLAGILKTWQPILITNKIQLLNLKF
jgi:hypothetical protein